MSNPTAPDEKAPERAPAATIAVTFVAVCLVLLTIATIGWLALLPFVGAAAFHWSVWLAGVGLTAVVVLAVAGFIYAGTRTRA